MVSRPRQQNPTQFGTDLFPGVIHAPIQVRLQIETSDKFVASTGVSAEQLGTEIASFYSTNVSHFVDSARRQRDLGGLEQHRAQSNLPGMDMTYGSNQGLEQLTLTVRPENAPSGSTSRTDQLLDGYIFLNFSVSAGTNKGYWVEIGGTKYFVYVLDDVSITTPGPPSPSLVKTPWLPEFGSKQALALFAPITNEFGFITMVVDVTDDVIPDNVNQTDPFEWTTEIRGEHGEEIGTSGDRLPGGYGPIDDAAFFPPITILLNTSKVASISIPTNVDVHASILLRFGPDAMRQHSNNDALNTEHLLNKILPPRKDKLLPEYSPLVYFSELPFLSPTITVIRQTVDVPKGVLNDFGDNVLLTNSEIGMLFVAEFYDRKSWRTVTQSPHFAGTNIRVNDKPLIWGRGGMGSDILNNLAAIEIDFTNPG